MSSVKSTPFGVLEDGQEVVRYDLCCGSLTASFISYGASLVSLRAPDRSGAAQEVVLGHRTLPAVLSDTAYCGATVGRVANRIAGGRFTLDGTVCMLAQNNGPNTLHGGPGGFSHRVWQHKALPATSHGGAVGVRFTYVSAHGEEGMPGEVRVTATYTLTPDNELLSEYEATLIGGADATLINITNHAYWNLTGDLTSHIKDHHLSLHCSRFLPVDAVQIPTREVADVSGTPFDLRSTTGATTLGAVIPLIDGGGGKLGLDHCFVIDGAIDSDGASAPLEMRPMAVLSHAGSGRRLELSGTQPGVQVYTHNWASEAPGDAPHCQHWGVALETQAFPDAPNVPAWAPQVVLRRGGEPYRHRSRHAFSTF